MRPAGRSGRPSWRVYVLTVTLAGICLLATAWLQTAFGFPSFLLFIPAVIFSAQFGGAGAGLVTTGLAGIGMMLLLQPTGSLSIASRADVARLLAFLAVALISVTVGARQRRLARALRRSEAEFRTTFEVAGAGLVFATEDDVVPGRGVLLRRVNQAYCDLTGYSPAELSRLTTIDLTHPDDREADVRASAPADNGPLASWRSEKRYIRKDGRVIWVLVHGRATRDVTTGDAAIVANVIDITERKEAEIRLRSAGRLKDEFLATLSHELRTPLNIIVGWSRMLAVAPPEPERLKKGLDVIGRNANAATTLVEGLLNLSEIITGRMRLLQEPLDLTAVSRGVVEGLSLAISGRHLTLDTRFEPVTPMLGDPVRVSQIAWNVLSNAIKFTPSGGHLRMQVVTEGEELVLRVSDTGRGIAPEFLPFVFDKFRQEDASTSREHPGLGVGLAITLHLVQLHGGTIRVESAGRDQGTTVTVRFPRAGASVSAAAAS